MASGSQTYEADLVGDATADSYCGTVFCYLPMPINSGLPVHINGAFAVTPNRRSLVEKVTDNKTNQLVDWNQVLLSDSLCKVPFVM